MFRTFANSIAILALSIAPALAAGTHPVIGISGASADSDSVRAMMTEVRSVGGTPLFLGNFAQRHPAADIHKIDGLVVMGNAADIDPARYGATENPHTVNEMKTPAGQARATYEYALMKEALAEGMPLLGICGGEQRLNVLRGGTLHQHVPDLVGSDEHAQHHYHIAPFVPVIPISIAPGTALAAIADDVDSLYAPGHNTDRRIMENSMHHQAVDTPGSGLRVAATSDPYQENGKMRHLVEAIEADPNGPLKDQFVLGVQWHPEFAASPLGPRIAATLVERARVFAAARHRAHPAGEAVKETLFSALPQVEKPANDLPEHQGGATESILREAAPAAAH